MYDSPITVVLSQLQTDLNNLLEDDTMLTITQKYGISINKDELVKALNYDRSQYNKGYRDAIDDFNSQIGSIVKDFKDTDLMTDDMYSLIDAIDLFLAAKRSESSISIV